MLTVRERDRLQDEVGAIVVIIIVCVLAAIVFPSMYKSLESHATRLESDNTESRLKLSDLNDKVAAQSEIIEQLKVYNDECRHIDHPVCCILRLI